MSATGRKTSEAEGFTTPEPTLQTNLPGGSAQTSGQEPTIQGLADTLHALQQQVAEIIASQPQKKGRKKTTSGVSSTAGPRVTITKASPTVGELQQAMISLQQQLQAAKVQPEGSEADLFDQEDQQGNRISQFMPSFKTHESLKRWGIKFSGRKGEDVEEFISSIDDALTALSIRDQDLLNVLKGILKGPALAWYRETTFFTWENAREAFRKQFGGLDYQIRLKNEMLRRTQGTNEAVTDYMRSIRGYFSKITPPMDEKTKVYTAYVNMLPKFRRGLDIDSDLTMGDLERLARRRELDYECEKSYRPPPTPETSVCPSLAYRERKYPRFKKYNKYQARGIAEKESDTETEEEKIPESEETESDTAEDAARTVKPTQRYRTGNGGNRRQYQQKPAPEKGKPKKVSCYNCNSGKHTYRECPSKERRLFCYRCGMQGTTQPECPKCHPNGRKGS